MQRFFGSHEDHRSQPMTTRPRKRRPLIVSVFFPQVDITDHMEVVMVDIDYFD